MDEVGNLSLPVNSLAALFHRLGHGLGTAGEDADLADVAVLLLDKLEEGGHVGSAEMVDGFEAGEHAAAAQALEVVLADVEHRGPKVKLVEELGDEDVHLQHIGHIFPLNIPRTRS